MKKIQEQLEANSITQYFNDINCIVSMENLVTFKKHNEISDGLYILIYGKVCYVSNNKSHYIVDSANGNFRNIDIDRK